MSIVPLNLGAAAPFRLNPHFLQVVAASSFSVPQFGQNTQHLLMTQGNLQTTRPLVYFSSGTASSFARPSVLAPGALSNLAEIAGRPVATRFVSSALRRI